MIGHWSEMADTLCGLQGTFRAEFFELERAVDVARGYVRELRFPTLMEELSDDLLNIAVHEAEAHRSDETLDYRCCPTVLALTLAAHALLNGQGELRESTLEAAEFEEGCRRVGVFLLLQKMRRMGAYRVISLPHDPWDDETLVICDERDTTKMAEFKQWLGYTADDGEDADEDGASAYGD